MFVTRCLCALLLVAVVVAISDGDSVEWNRHAYLVKLLSKRAENDVVACTGTLISPFLVLTASQCFADGDKPEAQIFSVRGNGTTAYRRRVISMKTEGEFALLTIHPIRGEKLCPTDPAPKRVSRLPLVLSLDKPILQPMKVGDLAEKNCRVVGFQTVAVQEFVTNHAVLQVPAKLQGNQAAADVVDKKGPCWDDIGLPLECQMDDETWTQVGLLNAMSAQDRETDICAADRTMKFAMFSEPEAATLLSVETAQIVVSQKECFHSNSASSTTD